MNKILFVLLLLITVGWFVFLYVQFSHTSPLEKSPKTSTITSSMQITSPVFSQNTAIPPLYTCDAKGINPPLSFSDIPKDAKSLALIVDDPDAPIGTFVHWVAYNIPVSTVQIEEGKGIPGSVIGKNGIGKENFVAPCPPNGQHRYLFKLYALDTVVSLGPSASKDELLEAMKSHVVDQAQLVGVYKRQ